LRRRTRRLAARSARRGAGDPQRRRVRPHRPDRHRAGGADRCGEGRVLTDRRAEVAAAEVAELHAELAETVERADAMDAELGQLRAALSRERAHRERAVAERDAQRGRRIVRAADRAAAVVRSARALTRQPVRALRRPRPQAADLESVAPLSVVAEPPEPPVALRPWSQRHWTRHTGSPTGESQAGRA